MNNWWSQIKTAGAAIYANRRFLDLYKRTHLENLAKPGIRGPDDGVDGNSLICNIIGDVFIHPTATIHRTATVSSNHFRNESNGEFHHVCLNSWDQMYRLEQMLILEPVYEFGKQLSWTMPSLRNIH